MKRPARTLVTAVLTAAVAFSVAPAASAAPKDKPAQVKTHGKAAGQVKAQAKKAAAAQKKAAAADRKNAAQQRGVTRDINRRIAFLDRVFTGDRLAGLDQDVIDAITFNVTIDRAALTAILDGLATDARPAREIRGEVRGYRVQTYNVVVGIAREAAAVTDTAAANEAALTELVASGAATDEEVSPIRAENAAAVGAARSAVDKALTLSAVNAVTDRAAAEADLEAAQASLAVVAAFLADYPVTQEPSPQDPAGTDPADQPYQPTS